MRRQAIVDDAWLDDLDKWNEVVRLPHDAILDNPDKLAALSGPCVTIVPAREVKSK